MEGQNISRLEEVYIKSRWNQREAIYLLKETDAGTMPGKPQPHGDIQINRNGLI